jgi:predicted alpha/beta-fold hydrolase
MVKEEIQIMITNSTFKPLWWLKNPHLQTLWANRSTYAKPQGKTERLELSDGDFLDLEWFDASGSLVLLLHGLEGSSYSTYAIAAIRKLQAKGFHVVFMHFRGCSGEPNRLDCSYHSGHTADLQEVLQHITQHSGKSVHCAIGYSLGGNVLLKWLGEQGKQPYVKRAIAISVPFVLADAAKRMATGLSTFYASLLLRRLRDSYHEKFAHRSTKLSVDVEQLKNFYQFDDQVTAPLNGFSGADEYYARSSSRSYLSKIQTTTLIIHARDDPFMYATTPPTEEELSPAVTLELAEHGGHVGFIEGNLLPKRWLEERLIAFIQRP